MALRSIRLYPDPVLRRKCVEVEAFDGELRQLVEDMVETMRAAPGIGLAAPQVGIDRRVAVVDVTAGEEDGAVHVLVNPEIASAAGRDVDLEGCLSIPDFTEKVERPFGVVVRAQDLDGQRYELEAEGLLARAICHEVDHLDGVLFTDRLRGLKRERGRRHLKRLRREHEQDSEAEQWASLESASSKS